MGYSLHRSLFMPVFSIGKQFPSWAPRSSNKRAVTKLMNHAEQLNVACSSLDDTQLKALDTEAIGEASRRGKQKATISQTTSV